MLVAYYSLNGNSIDSVNGYNGTDTNVTYVSGKIGKAASFNGTSAKVTIANNATLQITDNLTLCAWIKTESTGEQRIIINVMLMLTYMDTIYF